ncbi:hypothetical protein O181_054318 [Austropuccinia psidii MF-1]|uniref:Uncharacterized protein n=1 Tax=Austropuccinia psidii MF-1 TaxID=1389203 RepID=A0A9Q3E945_9BASI|nr:hypothetical protein [Austropuccinia psidii MF-1]
MNHEDNQGYEAITAIMTPSSSSIWSSRTALGPNQQAKTSPSALRKFMLSLVLDHSHRVKMAHIVPLDPLNPQKIWAQGLLYNPYRPQAVRNQKGQICQG